MVDVDQRSAHEESQLYLDHLFPALHPKSQRDSALGESKPNQPWSNFALLQTVDFRGTVMRSVTTHWMTYRGTLRVAAKSPGMAVPRSDSVP